MRVLVDIGHPAHVHLFKNLIWELEKNGHSINITARDKEVTFHLLNAYGIRYHDLGKHHKTLLGKVVGLVQKDYRLYRIAKAFNPDIFISHGSMYAAHASKMLGKPHIALADTEHSREQYLLYAPFTEAILTSSCFKKDLGKKQVRYDGYHELAYLHPNYFNPDPSVIDELNLSKNEKFFVLRFVSWEASHDIGQKGFDPIATRNFVEKLNEYGKVFITSEMKLENELEKYRINISPEKIHSLLYYAHLYIGEGATMASEAAVLGTPSIYVNTLRLGYTDEEEKMYGLVFTFSDPKVGQKQALEKVLELLKHENIKEEWQKKKQKLLKDKIDVTKFLTDFIENYPDSFYEYKETKPGA